MPSSRDLKQMGEFLPPGFNEVQNALSSARKTTMPDDVSISGVVVSLFPVKNTRNGDHQITFSIRDYTGAIQIRCFRKLHADLPRIKGIGDVVLLRSVQITPFNNEYSIVLRQNSSFVVFHKESIVSSAFREQYGSAGGALLPHHRPAQSPQPTVHEQQWVISLSENLSSTRASNLPVHAHHITWNEAPLIAPNPSLNAPTRPALGPARGFKFSLIKDLQVPSFKDLCVVVLKMFDENGIRMNLYVTDYTEHPQLHPYTDNGAGPGGRLTLRVELESPINHEAQADVRVGDIVELKNVRIKFSELGVLEGNIYPDTKYSHKKHVTPSIYDDGIVTALKQRRSEYDSRTARAFLAGEIQDKEQVVDKKTKKNKKKKRAMEAVQGQTAKKSRVEEDSIKHCQTTGSGLNPNSEQPNLTLPRRYANIICHVMPCTYDDTNQSLVIYDEEYKDAPLNPFDVVIQIPDRLITPPNGDPYIAPFMNYKHRVRLRVLDFYPHDLASFAVPVLAPDGRTQWRWQFCLVVCDGEGKLLHTKRAKSLHLQVADEEAVMLLGSLANEYV